MDRNKILWHLKGDRKDDQTLQDRDTIVTRRQRNRILQTVEKQVNNMWREFWRQTKGRRRLNSPHLERTPRMKNINPRHYRFLPVSRGQHQHREDTEIVCKKVKITQLQNGTGRRKAWPTAICACREVLQRNINWFRNNFIRLMGSHA